MSLLTYLLVVFGVTFVGIKWFVSGHTPRRKNKPIH